MTLHFPTKRKKANRRQTGMELAQANKSGATRKQISAELTPSKLKFFLAIMYKGKLWLNR